MSAWWIGTANREDRTYPIQILRESAQHIGFVRKRKGALMPASLGRQLLAGDALGAWDAVVERLPRDADGSSPRPRPRKRVI